jgi:cytochrome c oxidase subunit 2
MRGTFVIDNEADYRAWLDQQKTFAEMSAPIKKADATR